MFCLMSFVDLSRWLWRSYDSGSAEKSEAAEGSADGKPAEEGKEGKEEGEAAPKKKGKV